MKRWKLEVNYFTENKLTQEKVTPQCSCWEANRRYFKTAPGAHSDYGYAFVPTKMDSEGICLYCGHYAVVQLFNSAEIKAKRNGMKRRKHATR